MKILSFVILGALSTWACVTVLDNLREELDVRLDAVATRVDVVNSRIDEIVRRKNHVAATAASCLPTVVTIEVIYYVPAQIRKWADNDRVRTRWGSGVLIGAKGEILTCRHLIEPYALYTVTTSTGTKFPAEFVRKAKKSDLALLRVKGIGARYATLSPTGGIIGETVLAIGNPHNHGHTVTCGIVSAIHRKVTVDYLEFTGLIQSDAPINPGNSGGGLFTVEGKLLGIVSATCRSADGLGWAVPVKTIREFLAPPPPKK